MKELGYRVGERSGKASFGVGGLDPDALALCQAAKLSSQPHIWVADYIIKQFKIKEIWNSCDYIYLFLSDGILDTRQNQAKYNAKAPYDNNESFRLSFSTGWTFANTGASNIGSTFADTHYIESKNLTLNDQHICFATNNSFVSDTVGMGAVTTTISPTAATNILPVSSASPGGNKFIVSLQRNTAAADFSTTPSPSGVGAMWGGSRSVAATTGFFLNGVLTDTILRTSSNLNTVSHYIGSRNFDGVSNLPAVNEFIYASAGRALNALDAQNMYAIVKTGMSFLGRII